MRQVFHPDLQILQEGGGDNLPIVFTRTAKKRIDLGASRTAALSPLSLAWRSLAQSRKEFGTMRVSMQS